MLLPIALLALGVWLLVGCIYLPMFNRTTHGKNHATKVGPADSRKPVRVGQTTRDQVLKLLGMPYVQASDGSALAYTWTIQHGVAVWPLCFTANSVKGYRTLVLRFDAEGRLSSYNVLKADGDVIQLHGPYQPLPDDLRDEEHRRAYPPTTLRSQ